LHLAPPLQREGLTGGRTDGPVQPSGRGEVGLGLGELAGQEPGLAA
jgi:hypothetical protein